MFFLIEWPPCLIINDLMLKNPLFDRMQQPYIGTGRRGPEGGQAIGNLQGFNLFIYIRFL